jgi:hypothetical protein
MPLCNGADIGCVSHIDNITGRESGLTSLYRASHERLRFLEHRIGSGVISRVIGSWFQQEQAVQRAR